MGSAIKEDGGLKRVCVFLVRIRLHRGLVWCADITKGWLVFPHFDFVLDLSTCVHRADSCIYLPTEVCKLSAYCICRFLVLKRQHGASLLSGTCCCVCDSSDTLEATNWRMIDCTSLSG